MTFSCFPCSLILQIPLVSYVFSCALMFELLCMVFQFCLRFAVFLTPPHIPCTSHVPCDMTHVWHHNHLGPNLLPSPHHTLSPTSVAPKRKRVAEPEGKSAGSGATPAEVSKGKVELQEPCMSY